MHMIPMRADDYSQLFRILRSVEPHGHREWRFKNEAELRESLDNDRLDPTLGRWSLAYADGDAVGYSLTEPELNIGRVIVGVGAVAGNDAIYPLLLDDGIARARSMPGADKCQMHIGIRDHESPMLRGALEASDFSIERKMLKMRVAVGRLQHNRASSPMASISISAATPSSASDAAALTELHNACFVDSWGFSPNTAEEIYHRARADAERCGYPPILVAIDASNDEPIGYIWTTSMNGEGRIEMVGVSPARRRMGLGRAIFDAGIDHLLRQGSDALSLDVDAENAPARHIYEAAGFRTINKVRYYAKLLSMA